MTALRMRARDVLSEDELVAVRERFTWKGVEGKLRLGAETGFATGDQWDNTVQGNTNIAYAKWGTEGAYRVYARRDGEVRAAMAGFPQARAMVLH